MTHRLESWDDYAREFGVNLQRARHEKRLSQERVASAAGISVFTYRKLEKGQSNPGTAANPRLRTLIALAEVLETSPESLLPEQLPGIAIGR
ncbi:helix-turn-helix domain-containing protein [Gulosibacter sp. 10]|uniref:helix-turn-helix domain-containing protein n=1 Tax=Gulosibacter sp. 10 TaxID=1255570 RepID=UPI00097EE835|nr:helix-turn-helix transcriptional regulator [Gulosibacter sp. 10]SJM59447.1 hypothetical protein FM112_06505 [Gulosibacter sp. 10]